MRELIGIGIGIVVLSSALAAQTPQPFPVPRGSEPRTGQQAPPPAPPPTSQPPAVVSPAPEPPTVSAQSGVPDLGVPIYPNAVFITSYDAGRGQRFYLFGVHLSYADAVQYYRAALSEGGDELFESPPTHQFETGRYDDNTMAFPPSVTVKDYTWGGSAGYPNPHKGGPERFPTIIQVVPAPTPGR